MNEQKALIDKSLIKKLRLMGFLIWGFALIALSYAIFSGPSPEQELIEESLALDIADIPPIDPYIIFSSFALVGTLCILVSMRKLKKFKSNNM